MKYIIALDAGTTSNRCIIFDEKDEAEELKKKGRVLKEKLELDRKKGIAQ